MSEKDKKRGLYGKFVVVRVDGQSDPGKKHHRCDYFVLDLTHDPHAIPAIRAYVRSCRKRYPLLACDLDKKLSMIALTNIGRSNPRTR